MIGFKKISVSEEFVPAVSEAPVFEGRTLISSSYRNRRAGTIFWMPAALRELDAHIHWGESRRDNTVEQGGIMIGDVYRDEKTDSLFAIVEHVIPFEGAVGTSGFLSIGIDTSLDAKMLEEDMIRQSGGRLRRIGWFHTHPGPLSVFMSGTDMQTQVRDYSLDWQFAVVLNPQKRIWRGFRGRDAVEVDCVMVCDKKDPITAEFLTKTRFNYDFMRISVPVSREPAGKEPVSGEPVSGEPAGKEPVSGEPAGREPASGEPAGREPAEENKTGKDNKALAAIRDDSLCFGDYIIQMTVFAEHIYRALHIDDLLQKRESKTMAIGANMKFEAERNSWEFDDVFCADPAAESSDKEQKSSAGADGHEENNTVHTLYSIVHVKPDITEEEAKDMIDLYRFDDRNELLFIFAEGKNGTVKYYVSDREHHITSNEPA